MAVCPSKASHGVGPGQTSQCQAVACKCRRVGAGYPPVNRSSTRLLQLNIERSDRGLAGRRAGALGAEGAPVGLRAVADLAAEVFAQVSCGGEAACCGDRVDGQVAGLEEALG